MALDLVATLVVGVAATVPAGMALVAWGVGPTATRELLWLAPAIGLAVWVVILDAARAAGVGGTPWWVTLALALAGGGAALWSGAWRRLGEMAAPVAVWAGTFLVLLAPVWGQAGRPTVLGFNRNNDSVFNVVLAQLLADGRAPFPPGSVTARYTEYPLGSMDLTGGLAGFLGGSAFDAYMPALAILLAALTGVVFWLLATLGTRNEWLRIAGAVLAVLAFVPVNYFVQGSAPSLGMVTPLVAAMALAWEARAGDRPRVTALAALCAGAAVTIYGLAPLLWFGSFAGVLALVAIADRGTDIGRRLVLNAVAFGAGIAPALPGLVRARRFALQSANEFGSGVILGNLGQAADPFLVVGVDRKLALVMVPCFAAAALLVVAGLAWAVARAERLVTLLLLACAFATIYSTLAGPYYVAKSYTPLSVVLVALGVTAAGVLATGARGRARRAGVIALGLAAAAGILATAGYYLKESAKVPAQLDALEGLRPTLRAAAGPPLLVSASAQDWRAYFLRDTGLHVSALEGWKDRVPAVQRDHFGTILVDAGSPAPGPGWHRLSRTGGLDVYERRG